MRVFYNVEILGVSEGIWSVKNLRLTDGERQYERTCRPSPYLALWFSRFTLYPRAQSVKRRSRERRGEDRGFGNEKENTDVFGMFIPANI